MSRWLELSVRVPAEFVEPVAEMLRRYGKGAVAVVEDGYDPENDPQPPSRYRDATCIGYLPMDRTLWSAREHIRVGLALVSHLCPLPEPAEREVEENEWEQVWKSHFNLMRVGRRIVVKPSWQSYIPGPEDAVVELDPGMAFGTGYHPTTRMCLEALERLSLPGMEVLDVGSGSGILSIAAAKLGASRVVGVDIDPVAIRVARVNVRANGVSSQVRLYRGTLPYPRVPAGAFHLVLANITARTLTAMAGALASALRPEGTLVASGMLEKQAAQVEEAFLGAGMLTRERLFEGDWVAIVTGGPPR
ncbi:MAG: 50S ribosomal protein L11 methyltransferase [Chloroflexi bacterium]|nr:50S ribosomal protein L11 methyltransferase [Chloroflexota bacterium]